MITRADVPESVLNVAERLENAGFEAYLVGGCVRDLFIGKTPKDWDITTSATPEEIQALWGEDETYCNNDYGTVGVVNDGVEDETLKVVEVTPFRTESGYTDRRRPDQVVFGVSLEEDLKRRDFTVNAMAWRSQTEALVDIFNGQADITKKRLKTVGNPVDRFQEDALRLMRAVRLATELNFAIESETLAAIAEHHTLLKDIAIERVRDELLRIIDSPAPLQGIVMLERLQILDYVLPELKEGIGCQQGGIHAFDVYEHTLRPCQAAADKGFSTELRIAALLHDIAKPATRREGGKNKQYSFFGHEVVGAKITRKILQRLKMPRETAQKVENLVRWHMFFADPDEITLAAVRRTIVRIGEENIEDLLNLRVCDRIGTGRPKEQPFRFRKYKAMVDQALRDPISVKLLKTNGDRIMEKFGEKPGKKLGYLLHALLEEVLETPEKNTEEYLDSRTQELLALELSDLESLAAKGKERQAEEEAAAIKAIEREHKVG
jgi:poly(A) polymerase/tRNA nucleotidyltransferase (CCA-adding enzyme)